MNPQPRAAEKGERDLANSTVSNVGHQLQHLRHLLEQKRMAVGEAMDSWQKFLHMHAAVSQWSKDKRALLDESLAAFATIAETKQKLQVYAVAMKSIRYAAKNVQEMSRELAAISAVTTVTADLAEKLHSAEQMKAETEARLNERVRPLCYVQLCATGPRELSWYKF